MARTDLSELPHLPSILAGDRDDEAAERISDYYTSKHATQESRRDRYGLSPLHRFSGARFDTFAPDQDPFEITPADLLAVGLLGVHVPGRAAEQFLEVRNEQISQLLKKIPRDVELGDLSRPAFDRLLGEKSSPGHRLWDLLRGKDIEVKLRVGPTITSKILARKRPHLLPIYDEHIRAAMKLKDSGGHWVAMYDLMSLPILVERLSRIRDKARVENLPLLRVFDVATWHEQSKQPMHAASEDEVADPLLEKETVGEDEPGDERSTEG